MAKSKAKDKKKSSVDLEPLLTDRYFVGELERLAELHYLNLGIKRLSDLDKIFNPLLKRSVQDFEEPEREILRWMRNPDYWWFTGKHLFDIDIHPFQNAILKTLYDHPFPMLIASRGSSKSWMLALFDILYCLCHQNTKSVIAGAGFRQSRLVFEYIENFWNNGHVLRSVIGKQSANAFSKASDCWTFKMGRSITRAIPIGDGKKVRGFRANLLFLDEFQSQNPEIYETVLSGFGATSSDPVKAVKHLAKIEFYKQLGQWEKASELAAAKGININKQIISGTADYEFGHFFKYFDQYRTIINSGGDQDELKKYLSDKVKKINHKNFAIVRLPVELLPEGFMDPENISRSELTLPHNLFINEFGACFSSDSDGFYKASLVQSCVTNPPIERPSGPVSFSASLRGSLRHKYYYGIDPAQTKDNFAIVILEIHPDHRRVVYSWTTNDEDYKEKVKKGFVADNTFYSYCCRKIRSLMKVFPCEMISMDMQGGGRAIMEGLWDFDKMEGGEQQIWPIRSDHPLGDKKLEEYDIQPGLHLIEMVQNANFEYISSANNGLKKDLEDKILLFPFFDTLALADAFTQDQIAQKEYDTLEECVLDIEELKRELTSIQETKLPSGRSRWAAPELKLAGMTRAGADDRFMALLMANMAARSVERQLDYTMELEMGGFAGSQKFSRGNPDARSGDLYLHAPQWFLEQLNR